MNHIHFHILPILLFCIIVSSQQIEFTYGVPEDEIGYYSEAFFECKDGSKRISRSQVNDDYCDCFDGSDEPGTSACSNGFFYCRNEGHIALTIESSRVNDGICDCCDGSDEYNGFTKCENKCAEIHSEWEKENSERIVIFKEGSRILKEWIEESKNAIISAEEKKLSLSEAILSLEREIEAETAYLEELKAKWEEHKSDQTNTPVYERFAFKNLYKQLGLEDLHENELRYLIVATLSRSNGFSNTVFKHLQEDMLDVNDSIAVSEEITMNDLKTAIENKNKEEVSEEVEEQIQKVNQLTNEKGKKEDEKDALNESTYFGPEYEFYKMKGQCYEQLFNKYKYRVCPFGESRQDSTSLGNNFYIIDKDGKPIEELKMNIHVNEFNEMPDGDIYFFWDNGKSCWNGPKRSLKLRLVCHDSVKLLSLTEPSMCVYEGELGTPAVCPL